MLNTRHKGSGVIQNQFSSDLRKVYAGVGASNHSQHGRAENDFYATDPIAIELLMKEIKFSPAVWECACGKGHQPDLIFYSDNLKPNHFTDKTK